ncbi:YceH family protein [Ningiella sp. W23]|uniref:YceH family protein n=1 Tax=Ningiella sp. W23 TaxID=3023715 RepID=UPI003756B230
MLIQLSPAQARVIGVLIEKEITTPDQYPLSLNALMLGCNQKSSREPIMQLSENDVQNILDELRDKNLLFEHQGSGSRVVKYKHRFCNTEFSSLKFTPQQLGIICVLLLRGPQTPGELRTRASRLAEFANVTEVETTLHELSHFNGETLISKLEREPGKRESRYAHLFCGDIVLAPASKNVSELDSSSTTIADAGNVKDLQDAVERINTLEQQLANVIKRMDEMQETLDILSD